MQLLALLAEKIITTCHLTKAGAVARGKKHMQCVVCLFVEGTLSEDFSRTAKRTPPILGVPLHCATVWLDVLGSLAIFSASTVMLTPD